VPFLLTGVQVEKHMICVFFIHGVDRISKIIVGSFFKKVCFCVCVLVGFNDKGVWKSPGLQTHALVSKNI